VNEIKGGPRTAAYMLQYDSVNSRSWKRLRLSYIGRGRVLEISPGLLKRTVRGTGASPVEPHLP
jgi:hypothetical protein